MQLRIKIAGLVIGFLILVNIETIIISATSSFDYFDFIGLAVVAAILVVIFAMIKIIFKWKVKSKVTISEITPLKVWYLVGITSFVGTYSIGITLLDGLEFSDLGEYLFATGYFVIAYKLVRGFTWAWTTLIILVMFQVVAGLLLFPPADNSALAKPALINIVMLFLLFDPGIMKFFKKESKTILKYISVASNLEIETTIQRQFLLNIIFTETTIRIIGYLLSYHQT